jgi:hypothetical protein
MTRLVLVLMGLGYLLRIPTSESSFQRLLFLPLLLHSVGL